ncbi:MAG TPA: 4-hydroxy-tetrahydrodipicolinate reductase [Acidimicrobiia bacterium]|nr:4-hydroxy-tetrahydrodipicolinate reductase [Acidimicrobiia bacterium]
MAIDVGVFGAGGRMGSTVCQTVADAPDLRLVAAIDPHHAGLDLSQIGIRGPSMQVAAKADTGRSAHVMVDFTEIGAARENLRWCAANGVHAVVGTTGFTPDDFAEFDRLFASSAANAVIAPNFAIGAVLMMRFAELAAPYFESVEIIELHHDEKSDAPSGTAMLTAERMAAASKEWSADPTRHEVVPGARGGQGPGGIRIHSVRLRGLVAHQEVVFGTTGQSLNLRHDSYDRSSFMPGVLMAIRTVGDRAGLTVGLDTLLDV